MTVCGQNENVLLGMTVFRPVRRALATTTALCSRWESRKTGVSFL